MTLPSFQARLFMVNVNGIVTEETLPNPVSMYGATKLSGENLIAMYARCFGMKSWILRMANVVGERQTHGVIVDFIQKINNDKNRLEILGDGEQEKSYIYVNDCVDAILYVINNSREPVNLFNIGSGDTITVNEIAEISAKEMNANPKFIYTGGKTGWLGDIAFTQLSIEKLKKLGWSPRHSSHQAIQKTIKTLLQQK